MRAIPKKQILTQEHEGWPGQTHQGTIWVLIMFYTNRYGVIWQFAVLRDGKYVTRMCVSLHIKSRGKRLPASTSLCLGRTVPTDTRRFLEFLLHLRLNLTTQLRLPYSRDPPASASQGLWLQMCVTRSSRGLLWNVSNI